MADPYLTEVAWSGMSLRLLGRLEPDGSRPAEAELLLRERDGDGLISVPAVLPAAAWAPLRGADRHHLRLR